MKKFKSKKSLILDGLKAIEESIIRQTIKTQEENKKLMLEKMHILEEEIDTKIEIEVMKQLKEVKE